MIGREIYFELGNNKLSGTIIDKVLQRRQVAIAGPAVYAVVDVYMVEAENARVYRVMPKQIIRMKYGTE